MDSQFSYVKVGICKGQLRINFSRKISQDIFRQERKYLYLKLTNNESNRKIAQAIAIQIDNDIIAKKLDPTLKSYLPSNSLKKEVGIAYNPNEAKISLIDLFDIYYETIVKDNVAITTAKITYEKIYKRILRECEQDLNKQQEIVDFIYKRVAVDNGNNIYNLINRMIIFGKNRGLIPEGFIDNIQTIKEDYRKRYSKYTPPDFVYELIPNYVHDYDKKGFSPQETGIIIKAFEEYAQKDFFDVRRVYAGKELVVSKKLEPPMKKHRQIARDFIKLKFWTGCRSGEASALRWQDISNDFKEIYFRNIYDPRLKILKPLKTEKVGLEGTETRVFPCGDKLSKLLENMYDKRLINNSNDFLFFNDLSRKRSQPQPFNTTGSTPSFWGARLSIFKTINGEEEKHYKLGVVAQLLVEQKISQYLRPYATRSTWITHQLNNNVPIATVAKLAGNSPDTIMKYYSSYLPNESLAPEF